MKYLWISFVLQISVLPGSLAAVHHMPLVTRGFSNTDSFSTTTSQEYNSEVESDSLTFSPIACDYQLILKKTDSAACTTIGSLSKTRFFVDQVFSFSKPVNESVKFRAQFNKKQNYSWNSQGEMVEFLHNFYGHQYWGIHGHYDAEKATDDIGFSYDYIDEKTNFRSQLTFQDFTRNERNENQDNFNVGPMTLAFSYQRTLNHTRSKDSFFIRTIVEPYWAWERPSASQLITRQRHSLDGFYNSKNMFTSIYYLNDELQNNSSFQNSHIFQWHYQQKLDWALVGIRYVDKYWRTDQGQLKHYDTLPFIWVPWLIPHRLWDVGVEATWHRAIGDEALKSPSDQDGTVESRLNISWKVFDTQAVSFKLLFTFDLDRFGTGDTWEGGNGQFFMVF